MSNLKYYVFSYFVTIAILNVRIGSARAEIYDNYSEI